MVLKTVVIGKTGKHSASLWKTCWYFEKTISEERNFTLYSQYFTATVIFYLIKAIGEVLLLSIMMENNISIRTYPLCGLL